MPSPVFTGGGETRADTEDVFSVGYCWLRGRNQGSQSTTCGHAALLGGVSSQQMSSFHLISNPTDRLNLIHSSYVAASGDWTAEEFLTVQLKV